MTTVINRNFCQEYEQSLRATVFVTEKKSQKLTRVNPDRNKFSITIIYFFTLQRFGPSPSRNFKYFCFDRLIHLYWLERMVHDCLNHFSKISPKKRWGCFTFFLLIASYPRASCHSMLSYSYISMLYDLWLYPARIGFLSIWIQN